MDDAEKSMEVKSVAELNKLDKNSSSKLKGGSYLKNTTGAIKISML